MLPYVITYSSRRLEMQGTNTMGDQWTRQQYKCREELDVFKRIDLPSATTTRLLVRCVNTFVCSELGPCRSCAASQLKVILDGNPSRSKPWWTKQRMMNEFGRPAKSFLVGQIVVKVSGWYKRLAKGLTNSAPLNSTPVINTTLTVAYSMD